MAAAGPRRPQGLTPAGFWTGRWEGELRQSSGRRWLVTLLSVCPVTQRFTYALSLPCPH